MAADRTAVPETQKAAALLKAVANAAPVNFNRGMERETLRVTSRGELALTSHPESLGSKLTHPLITTDFSESQPELITAVHSSASLALEQLGNVHKFISQRLVDEILWSASIPCQLPADATIPLADFGKTSLGRLKKIYRSGLGLRYGRSMQTLCAIHYNFSLADETFAALRKLEAPTEGEADYRTRRYFDLMRNFRRWGWLLTWLFGASPAVDRSFVQGRQHALAPLDDDTLYLPYATSLRSGNLGYRSNLQDSNIAIDFNSLGNYVAELARAICKTHPDYERLTQVSAEGDDFQQLNCCILQSEAEFYSSIRAKRTTPPGTNFLQCLLAKGVEYIEVRLLDLNPYSPLGITREAIDFMDTLLAACLLMPSPQHDARRCQEIAANLDATASRGRDPSLKLFDDGQQRSLKDWGNEILGCLVPVAEALDEIHGSHAYTESLATQQLKMADVHKTPSARMLADMQDQKLTFQQFALGRSIANHQLLLAEAVSDESKLDQLARDSILQQQELDSREQPALEGYLRDHQAGYEALL